MNLSIKASTKILILLCIAVFLAVQAYNIFNQEHSWPDPARSVDNGSFRFFVDEQEFFPECNLVECSDIYWVGYMVREMQNLSHGDLDDPLRSILPHILWNRLNGYRRLPKDLHSCEDKNFRAITDEIITMRNRSLGLDGNFAAALSPSSQPCLGRIPSSEPRKQFTILIWRAGSIIGWVLCAVREGYSGACPVDLRVMSEEGGSEFLEIVHVSLVSFQPALIAKIIDDFGSFVGRVQSVFDEKAPIKIHIAPASSHTVVDDSVISNFTD